MTFATETTPIDFRDVEGIAEMRAIEDLQIAAWGDDERDIVPLNQFVAARYVGGTLIGAFEDEKLAGFVYGFYGHVRGQIVHHSHMLAVHPAYRNHKLGFRLKLAQRERVLADGLTDRITWTFDPLQSLNAHFNFTKLGVISDSYKINVYGEAGASFLHQNGTDRLFVTWLLESTFAKDRIAGNSGIRQKQGMSPDNTLRLLGSSDSGLPEQVISVDRFSAADFALVEIPADINSIEQTDFNMARKWRAETRRVFSEALAAGFIVTDYYRKNEKTGTYLLEKGSSTIANRDKPHK